MKLASLAALAFLTLAVACGQNWLYPDADTHECTCGDVGDDFPSDPPVADSGTPGDDDAGDPSIDGGEPTVDAGTPVADAGTPDVDAGNPTTDAGTPPKQCKPGYGWGDKNHCHLKSCGLYKPGKN